MSGMERRGNRIVSAALAAWERETDAVRAEYRRRERQAAGSGDGWLAQRTELLRRAAGAENSPTLQGMPGASGEGQRAGTRAYPREERTSTLARLVRGGGH